MSNTNQSLRLLAILVDTDHVAFLASARRPAARPKGWTLPSFPRTLP